MTPPLCLVHLCWMPYGLEPPRRFLESYRAHEAGAPHRLLVVFAGAEIEDRGPWHRLFDAVDHERLDFGDGIDLDHYRAAVDRFEAERYCFLNTESVVLVDDWLGRMARALAEPGVGVVGATGSYETPNAVRPGPLRRLRPGHDPFPNPHLRTNAFALERELILDLEWPTGLGKLEAVALEGGSRSITRQVQARGLQPLVVGRDGAYPPERWREARTFRRGEQENLLVSDNRTRHYQGGGRLTRAGLTWLAWQKLR
ncbi:MAG TPA: hypothetical protein VLI94_06540 [Solirubrobacterales bacterium]|nr:hypothetical protein [Solirubrobacterales bacterium]